MGWALEGGDGFLLLRSPAGRRAGDEGDLLFIGRIGLQR